MAKNHTKHGKKLAPKIEGTCKECQHKPEDKYYCFAKKRPVSDSHSCKDDFKARKVKNVEKPSTTKSKSRAKPEEKSFAESLNEKFVEAIRLLMAGGNHVTIDFDEIEIIIRKKRSD
jgi:hypothetical protein